jgi:hypothetical protein
MTPEIRLEAVKIASAIHRDVDSIITSAERLVHFVSGASTDAKPTKPTKQTQPATQPPADTAAPPSAQSTAAQEPAASTSKPGVVTLVYDDVKKLILKLTPINRAAALKVLSDHGVQKGPDLKPEQFASAHAALTKAISEHEKA